MKRFFIALLLTATATRAQAPQEDWQWLFDGHSLTGWMASEAASTFSVRNGELVVHGPKSHLYFLHGRAFRNFQMQLEVLTFPGANSGVYFHTEWQASDWPAKGYEVQVNNSHTDPKRTAGLYGIADNAAKVARDNEWFTLDIRVQGKRIVTAVNGKVVTDFTEPTPWNPPQEFAGRRLGEGTFAIQGHDPGSEVHYRNIRVRRLP